MALYVWVKNSICRGEKKSYFCPYLENISIFVAYLRAVYGEPVAGGKCLGEIPPWGGGIVKFWGVVM